MAEERSIAIIGAGPAGLSMAKLLSRRKNLKLTIFEANPTVGGKSYTLFDWPKAIEMGTCYTTLAHGLVKKWMRDYGIALEQNGTAKYDGRDFVEYVDEAPGPPLPVQAAAFLWGAKRLEFEMRSPRPSQSTLEEAAKPVADWVAERGLSKIEKLLHRIQTVMGYGFIDKTSTYQSQVWANGLLIATGYLNQMHMPREGWSTLWRRMAEEFDVRTGEGVLEVARSAQGVELRTAKGAYRFDEVVCAIPFDDFVDMADASAEEQDIARSFQWEGYTTTLVATRDWFTAYQVDGYSEAAIPGAALGKCLGARLEAFDEEQGEHLYVTGQLPGDYTNSELREILLAEIQAKGARDPRVLYQRTWKYFPKWDMEAVRDGLVTRLRELQGEKRTWFTGPVFAFESVAHVVNHNRALAPRVGRLPLAVDRPVPAGQSSANLQSPAE